MKATLAILAAVVIPLLVSPAMAQDMPVLTYDFTWTVDSGYSALNGGGNTTAHFTGSGPLTYVATPPNSATNFTSGSVTMSFGTPTNGGHFEFVSVGTAAGLHADDTFSFTTGLEALNPPIPPGCGRFPSQGPCRVAEFTTPSNAFAAPSSFTLEGQYSFSCPGPGIGCNGAGSWSSSLTGTATLHTTTAAAAEPGSLIVVAAGLLGARMLRRRR
jgi:hypothetical protein